LTENITLKKYTHLFFDLDNTLWDFKKNSKNAMLEAFGIFHLETKLDFDLFFDTYSKNNHALWDLYRKNEIGKKELTRLRFQNTFNELAIDGIDPDKMNKTYLDVMPDQKVLNEGALELVKFLESRKYKLFIITNGFKDVQLKKLESSGLKPFFNKIFISEEIKTPKPGREIFEYAVKSSNAKKSKSIMIGDDWETDIMGAVNFGIDAIHYVNGNTIEHQQFVTNNLNRTIYKTGSFQQLQLLF